MSPILILIILTILPVFELRASIPYGIFRTDLSLLSIFLTCTVANILLAPLLYFFFNHIVHIFLKINVINKHYQKTVARAQKKVSPYIKKYGILGLAIFIGVPLPGTGVYTGVLGAYLLGFKLKDILKAAIIGVLLAAVIVTLISVSGSAAFQFLIKKV